VGKILVLFDSQSQSTRKIAALVAQGAAAVEGMEVRLKGIDEARSEDLAWCDGIAVGSPTHMGGMSWKMKQFWDGQTDLWGKIDGKIGCAFSSSGGWGGGNELVCLSILITLINFGFLVFGVTDYVGKQFTLHYGAVQAGEPRTETEQASPMRLGKRLAQWVAVQVDGRKDLAPGPMESRA